jgi:hypothetical protein
MRLDAEDEAEEQENTVPETQKPEEPTSPKPTDEGNGEQGLTLPPELTASAFADEDDE